MLRVWIFDRGVQGLGCRVKGVWLSFRASGSGVTSQGVGVRLGTVNTECDKGRG